MHGWLVVDVVHHLRSMCCDLCANRWDRSIGFVTQILARQKNNPVFKASMKLHEVEKGAIGGSSIRKQPLMRTYAAIRSRDEGTKSKPCKFAYAL